MVDTGGFGDVGKQILDRVVSGGVLVVGGIILSLFILGIGLYIRYLRQFNIKVEIKALRGSGGRGEPIYKIVNDTGAFITNRKDHSEWFRLRGERVDLPLPPLECLQLDAKGKNNIKIYQKSATEYYYLLPDTIDVKNIIRNGKQIPVAQGELKIVEGDISYWNILRKKDNRKIFDTESLFMKLLPYIIPVLMFMLVIFMTYMITDHWGEFSSAAQALKEAAYALRDTTSAAVTTG